MPESGTQPKTRPTHPETDLTPSPWLELDQISLQPTVAALRPLPARAVWERLIERPHHVLSHQQDQAGQTYHGSDQHAHAFTRALLANHIEDVRMNTARNIDDALLQRAEPADIIDTYRMSTQAIHTAQAFEDHTAKATQPFAIQLISQQAISSIVGQCGSIAHTNHPHRTSLRRPHGHGYNAVYNPAQQPGNDQLNSWSIWFHSSHMPSTPYNPSKNTRPRLQCRLQSSSSAASKRSAQQLVNLVPQLTYAIHTVQPIEEHTATATMPSTIQLNSQQPISSIAGQCGSIAHTNHPHRTRLRRPHGHGYTAVCNPAQPPATDQLNSRSMWLHSSHKPSAPYKASKTTRPRLQCRLHL